MSFANSEERGIMQIFMLNDYNKRKVQREKKEMKSIEFIAGMYFQNVH